MLSKENLKLALIASFCLIVGWTGPSIAHGVAHAQFAHNADKVDGKHAVGAGASLDQAKGKLVAHGAQGKLPAKFIPLLGTGQLKDAAVTESKLADAAVTASKLGAITVVSNTTSTAANGAADGVTATCPEGTRVIAGGFDAAGSHGWRVGRSVRVGNGWRAYGINQSGSNSNLTALAYCLE